MEPIPIVEVDRGAALAPCRGVISTQTHILIILLPAPISFSFPRDRDGQSTCFSLSDNSIFVGLAAVLMPPPALVLFY